MLYSCTHMATVGVKVLMWCLKKNFDNGMLALAVTEKNVV